MNESVAPVAETRAFDAEVHQLLKLMINALYSNREIFLRELISNASDALDKLRFLALTDAELAGDDQATAIEVLVDVENHKLVIQDNGVGMTRQEVIENIGTIARSGTARFLESLSGDRKADAQLIGQFGVGFYSAFIVSDRVTLETRRAGAGADEAVRWSSDGEGEYMLEAIERQAVGTRVELELSEAHRDLLDVDRIKGIIRHYSNHVSFPIFVRGINDEELPADQSVNDTQALWTRSKSDISDQEYAEFYQGLTGDLDAPLSRAHHHVEGAQSYSMLLFLPPRAPYDMAWNRDDRHGLKLYIQRVFIMDAADQLLPRYLRFVRGVVDSADLPLNVSREILQESALLSKIRSALVRRALDMIEKLAKSGGEDWSAFQREFCNVLKEGIIEDPDNRERVAQLLRFSSTHATEPYAVALAEYLDRAKAGQATGEGDEKSSGDEPESTTRDAGDGNDDPLAIWYLTAENRQQALASPHLEAFSRAGVEVLLLTDPVDVWLVNHLHEFDGVSLKSAASGQFSDPQLVEEADGEPAKQLAGRIKQALGDRVGNVRPSSRLTESASCIAEEANGMTMQMRRMLQQAGQDVPEYKPDLEINARHPLLQRIEATADDVEAGQLAEVLLDQALLIDGGELADPAGFVRRVNQLLSDPGRGRLAENDG
ncbi:MAG: molecular chaperone HtpG [Xanthomonadaceae bacterium]|nr:molecular chaperone HtpG [Xanthomonadaceae bacterium]